MKRTFTLITALFCGGLLLFGQVPHKLEKDGDFWLIDSPGDLIWLSDTMSLDADNDGTADFDSIGGKMDANYRLAADITFDPDFSSVDWNNDGIIDPSGPDQYGWLPIGYKARPDGSFIHFKGTFNGQYHTISNIYCRFPNNRSGLFGGLQGGTIENLKVMNFNSHPIAWYPAILVGRAEYEGTDRNIIRRCWVEGTIHDIPTVMDVDKGEVRANMFVAGITGRLGYGDISKCVAKVTGHANTTTQRRIGGITGQMGNSATIKNSYVVAMITGEEQTGGLLGRANDETVDDVIENCYSVGLVVGKEPRDEVGNFAGNTGALTITSCYWDKEKHGDDVGVPDGINKDNVVGLMTAEFATEANFVGWDFTNTWKMGTVDGDQRPYLQWQDLVNQDVAVRDVNADKFRAYPNPVSGILTIENAPLNVPYVMMNMVGQTVESGVVSGRTMMLNTGKYQKGIYLLKIYNRFSAFFRTKE